MITKFSYFKIIKHFYSTLLKNEDINNEIMFVADDSADAGYTDPLELKELNSRLYHFAN